jgi:Flp pilus assembly protein TadG
MARSGTDMQHRIDMERIATPRSGRALRALLRRDEGSAAVEFAIVLPVLLLVLFGIVDFGRAFWTYNVAVSALREGGRAAAVAGLTGTTCPSTEIVDRARARTVTYLQTVFGTGPQIPSVTVTCTAGIIQVGYTGNAFPFTPIAPLVSKLTATSITVRPAVFRWEKSS